MRTCPTEIKNEFLRKMDRKKNRNKKEQVKELANMNQKGTRIKTENRRNGEIIAENEKEVVCGYVFV